MSHWYNENKALESWITRKMNAPGEARTHNLRMAHSTPYTDYKYGALTDCATGALSSVDKTLWIDKKFNDTWTYCLCGAIG